MKSYLFAAAACALLFSVSAKAAPVSTSMQGVQNQVTGEAIKVWHCRAWSGGWGCGGGGWGWHNRWRSHHRWGSRRYWR